MTEIIKALEFAESTDKLHRNNQLTLTEEYIAFFPILLAFRFFIDFSGQLLHRRTFW